MVVNLMKYRWLVNINKLKGKACVVNKTGKQSTMRRNPEWLAG